MKIGIGVTSYNRPKHLDLWVEQILPITPENVKVHIEVDKDTDRRGVAYRKNECLKALKGCDYIFLFDDDCFPIAEGWIDFFINAHKETGQHHFLYLKETSTIKKINEHNGIAKFNNCGGTMLFLTKKVIKEVGGFCKDYGIYGYEHAGYSRRIHAAGLTPMGEYLSPLGAEDFIYAMDYDNYLPFNKQVNHKPSLIDELNSLTSYVDKNKSVFLEDIKTTFQAL